MRAGVLAALAVAASALVGGAAHAARPDPTEAPTKELRYDGRTELGGAEKMLSLALTGGAFAALTTWAWKRNREDDELEQIRILEEVERLEKLKAEFLDVDDEDAIDDEDFYKDLSKRLEKDAEKADDAEDADEEEEGEDEVVDETNGEVVAEDEGEKGAESLDMLRRMWDATDEDSKGGKKPKSA